MECNQFNESLQSLLDSNLKTLPVSAEKHRQSCENCRVLYEQLLELKKVVKEAPKPTLLPWAEIYLVKRISKYIIQSNNPTHTPSLWHNVLNSLTSIRWRRVLFASAPVVVGLMLIFHVFAPNTPELTTLQAGNDIEFLLEEHAFAMESGIFQGTSQYVNLITTTEQEQ